MNVFDVQRYCVHDGPGIRTTVFLVGCAMRCKWCHNPESQLQGRRLRFTPSRCQTPEICVQKSILSCERDALSLSKEGTLQIDWEKCHQCLKCVGSCPHGTLEPIGHKVSPQDLLHEIIRDKHFFDTTGGGITLSGGEPLLQSDAIMTFLTLCKQAGIHCVVETAGGVPWKSFTKVLPLVDEWYFDIKGVGESFHKNDVRFSEVTIRQNMVNLLNSGAKIHFRMTVVPGYNTECVGAVGELFQSMQIPEITLLKYNSLGDAKLDTIKTKNVSLAISEREAVEKIDEAERILKDMGIAVTRYDNIPNHVRQIFSERVLKLKNAVCSSEYSACIERSDLLTDFCKKHLVQTEDKILSRAKGFAYVLRHRKVKIYDHELLVGNFTSKRVGGHIYMDYHGFVNFDMAMIDRRRVNPLQFSKKEKWTFYTKLLPYWLFRNHVACSVPWSKVPGIVHEQLFGTTYVTPVAASVAHFTPNFKSILELGTSGLISQSKQQGDSPFQQAMQIACQGLESLADLYAIKAQEMAAMEPDPVRAEELLRIANVCHQVPRHPASTFHEAIQCLVLTMIALTIEVQEQGLSFGRMDQLLYPYYQADIEAGRITPEQALELIGCFTVKLSELSPCIPTSITDHFSGMMSGQAADFGGIDPETGECACNPLTHMFIDAAGLGMRQPNYHARVSSKNHPDYLAHIAQLLCSGSPTPSIFNDDIAIDMLAKTHKVPIQIARDYCVVGCVELSLTGNHFGDTDWALINIVKPLSDILKKRRSYASMNELIASYQEALNAQVDDVVSQVQPLEKGHVNFPTPLSDVLIEGCLEKQMDVNEGGALYNSSGVQGVGVADVADSLAAIDELVFTQKVCSLEEMAKAVHANFKGYDFLRSLCKKVPKFGNDHPLPDKYAQIVMDCFARALARHRNTRGGPYVAGHYSMTTHVVFGKRSGALPSGRLAGEAFSNGLSPAIGSERLGPTATLNSVAKLSAVPNGSVTNIMLDIDLLRGQNGINVMQGLMRGFLKQGGLQMQLNILDKNVLLNAMKEPEKYRNLLVRVSGYCAYFHDLTPEMKQLLIDRSWALSNS